MPPLARLLSPLLAAALLSAPLFVQAAEPSAARIVSLGGTATEILYALGAGDRVIAVDTTSTYPAEASQKPNVGYMRQLSAEGIIAQQPDLIIAEEGAGPPDAINILKASGIAYVTIPSPPSVDAVGAKIRAVGAAIGAQPQAEALATETEAKLAAFAADQAARAGADKRVLFVLSAANGKLMAAGTGTAADAIIRFAGAVNATGDIAGYKPLSDEAAIAAAPDVVMMMDHVQVQISPAELFAMPGLAGSPAAKSKALVAVDALQTLGLGPRTPDAARALAARIRDAAAGR